MKKLLFLLFFLFIYLFATADNSHTGIGSYRIIKPEDCTSSQFNNLHEPFRLYEAQRAYQVNKEKESHALIRRFSFGALPSKKPFPLITPQEVYTKVTRYPYVGYGQGAPYDEFVVIGWRYGAPNDAAFRLALAQAMLCETKVKNSSFGDVLRSWLNNHGIYKMYMKTDGKSEEVNIDKNAVAVATLMTSMFDEFKKEIESNNPLIKRFLEDIFIQIKENELRLSKGWPLVFTEGFLAQSQKLYELFKKMKEKRDLTKDEEEFIRYFMKFSQEPRFSYLLHPLVASYMKSVIGTGSIKTNERTISGEQLKDINLQLKRSLGVTLPWVNSPRQLSASIIGREGKAVFNIPDPTQAIVEGVRHFLELLSNVEESKSDEEKKDLIRKKEYDLLSILNNYDELKHAPSPEFHGVRQAILRGISLLEKQTKPDQQNVGEGLSDTLDQYSKNEPRIFHGALESLTLLSRKVKSQFAPSAVIEVSKYDPILKALLDSITNRFSKFDPEQEKAIKIYLENGDSRSLFKLLLSSPSFYSAAAHALEEKCADNDATKLMSEIASNMDSMTESQHVRYQRIRESLLKDILKKPLENLNERDKANLVAIAMLDEFGLSGLTARDDKANSFSSKDYYQPGVLYGTLRAEREELSKIAEKAELDLAALEKAVYDHAVEMSEKRTGLPYEIRRTLAARVADQPISSEHVPRTLQEELIGFLKRRFKLSDEKTRKLGQHSLEEVIFRPITLEKLDTNIGAHSGFESFYYYQERISLGDSSEIIRKLAQKGFFKKEIFRKLFSKYKEKEDKLLVFRKTLAQALLDYVTVQIEREKRSLNSSQNLDPAIIRKISSYDQLRGFLTEVVINPRYQAFILPIVNMLLRDIDTDNVLNELGFNSEIMPSIKSAIEELKKSGVKEYLTKNLGTLINNMEHEEVEWEKILSRQLLLSENSNDLENEKLWVEKMLREFYRYGRAMADLEFAILRNPDDETPKRWKNDLVDFFHSKYLIKEIDDIFGNDREYSYIAGNLEDLAKEEENSANEKALKRHDVFSRFIADLGSKFRLHNVNYDPVTNAIVISNSSLIDDELYSRLKELGNYNILIEPENTLFLFNGHEALEDWLRRTRFQYGYIEASVPGNDKAEKYLPLTDRTAVKVFRNGGGTYRYKFANKDQIRKEIDAYEEILKTRRREWIEAQYKYNSPLHAIKAYSGAIIRLDPSNTSQARELSNSYNRLMKALSRLEEMGHVESSSGVGADKLLRDNRALISQKLYDEAAAIEGFINKVEVIHDITVTLLTIPAGGALESASLKMAQALTKGASSAVTQFAARSLYITAKAARALRLSTVEAAKSALTFTAIAAGAEGAMLLGNTFFGEGPRLIREKILLAEKTGYKNWRTWPNPPRLMDFISRYSSQEEALEKFRKAMFEYQIEENLDPDGDGIPNNHSFMDRKISGISSRSELLWSPVEQFRGNLRFFQGLNLARSAFPHGGLPYEMAAASLWTKFNVFDPTRFIEEERKRFQAESRYNPNARERNIEQIAFHELMDGALEGARFSLALIPTRFISKRLPNNFLNRLIGTGTFMVSDEALKQASTFARTGSFDWDYYDPSWRMRMFHSMATSGYIGWSVARGAQLNTRFERAKARLGITNEGGGAKRASDLSTSQSPLEELIKTDFRGNESDFHMFLRTITPQEIGRAPKKVQDDFFKYLKVQREKALEEMKQFAEKSNQPQLKKFSEELGKIIPQIDEFTEKARREGTISPAESAQLNSLILRRNILFMNISKIMEPFQEQASKAKDRIARANYRMREPNRNDVQILKNFEDNFSLLNQAIARLETREIFQEPIIKTTAVLSPDSELAGSFLGGEGKFPNALKALRREMERIKNNPTLIDEAKKVYDLLKRADIAPGSSTQGYERARRQAASLIISARKNATNSQEREELLNLLRIVNPEVSIELEKKENLIPEAFMSPL